ncbi:N-acetylmuramoyl-L-alanine amidase [Rubritalea spongiae]|uniref:N-acetylmuramoyl-L-alanine amidase n=1 Tax=Rubritalea spongiae TaxID=430797 RepID=A0ABW5DY97_9BACT
MNFLRIVSFIALSCSMLHAGSFKHVVIDPGHGGKDKGAYWGGVKESDINLKVAKKLANILRANDLEVTLTRDSDQFVSLSRRAELSNRYRDTIFISIHFNASTHTYVHGVETFYASSKGKQLANAIHSSMLERLNAKNRRIRLGDRYAVLTKTNCTAVLVECGYISNWAERQNCKRSWYHSLTASAIADGILHYR